MMCRIVLFACLLLSATYLPAQQRAGKSQSDKPKLVVGIVVDQMRYDYLVRFSGKYSNDGFRRLLRDGFSFSNARYDYVPTNTAPGHACIYTGTGPAYNGIINNDWYDRKLGKSIYCVNDTTEKPVGTTSISGKMSPRNLLSSTVTDELRLASNNRSKVIGIALKDRGAILPAGQTGNAAYWHDPYTNNWVSSTYYLKELPKWAIAFNDRRVSDSLLTGKWNTLLPISEYTESAADNNPYEGLYDGESKPVFPRNLDELKKENSELIRSTPMGNTFTLEFAKAAIAGEHLGKGTETDFLAVSFSSTDYVGHMFGIHSIELEDTYLRLDRDLADLLSFLDKWLASDYLIFLTSDHGAAHNPGYASTLGYNAEFYTPANLSDSLKQYLKSLYQAESLVGSVSAHNVYLDREAVEASGLDIVEVQERCASFLKKLDGVSIVMTANELEKGLKRSGFYAYLQNGFNADRSSDVSVLLKPGWISWYRKTGTNHGSPYSYDNHVPLIFSGKGIRPGSSDEGVHVADIAPTISSLLDIEFPSACTGRTLITYLK